MLGRSHKKWRQHPDMTIAIDWDAKPLLKQIFLTIYTEVGQLKLCQNVAFDC